MPAVRGLRRTSCLAVALLAFSAIWETAGAGDWSLRTNLTETLSFNDNIGFVVDPDGDAFGAFSKIGLTSRYVSDVDDFVLGGSLGYQSYFGVSNDIPGNRLMPSLNTSYMRKGKSADFSIGASLVYQPASQNTGLEIPDAQPSGDIVTLSANSSVAYKVDARNTLSLAARASKVDFVDKAATDVPFKSLGSTLTWQRKQTKRVDFNVTSGLDWYDYDDAVNRERYYYVLRGGTAARLSNRMSVTGNLGGTLSSTLSDAPNGDSSSLGALADAGFTYALKDGALAGAVSYGLTPDDAGVFSNSLNFSASITHRVNDLTNLRLGGQFQLSDSSEDGTLANASASISPSLTYTLARDWTLTASYQFAWKDDEAGAAIQNSVFLTVSRDYVLIP